MLSFLSDVNINQIYNQELTNIYVCVTRNEETIYTKVSTMRCSNSH